jgi:phosphate transport system substrate-binding protein
VAKSRRQLPSVALSLLAAGALAVSACSSSDGSSSNTPYAGSAVVNCGGRQSLNASGSTAQANAMARFVSAFESACSGQTLKYTPNGSGAGVQEFISNQTDFAGSDSPLSQDQDAKARNRCGSEAWHLPMVFGPLAITYQLANVGTLVLDAPTLAKIFNGTITKWNDPAITRLNPSMPSEDIHVVYRSDESGSTDNFQQYLQAASDGAWSKGAGKSFNGGVGVGAKGNDGTAAAVKNTEGAITYNEWSFAQAQNLSWAKIVTSGGPDPVNISTETVGKTIAAAKVAVSGNDLVLDTSSEVGKAVKAFLQSAIGPGQAGLGDHGYVPLPADFRSKVSTAVNAIA